MHRVTPVAHYAAFGSDRVSSLMVKYNFTEYGGKEEFY